MRWCYLLLVVLIIDYHYVSGNIKTEICSAEDIADTDIEDQTYLYSEPSGASSDNVAVIRKLNVLTNNECIRNCCTFEQCDAVSVIRNMCILHKCNSLGACTPKKVSQYGPKTLYIVLMSLKNNTEHLRHRKVFDDESQPCELSVPDNCPVNEMCKRIHEDKRTGVCVCISGFVKQSSGCVQEKVEIQEGITPGTSPSMTSQSTMTTRRSTVNQTTHIRTSTSTSGTRSSTTLRTVTKPIINNIVANAGPDLHVQVNNPQVSSQPVLVSILGSATDKQKHIRTNGISYEWKRDPKSLTVGTVVNESDHRSTLVLMNLLRGHYIFVLTVIDKDGDQSSDSVNVFVTEKADERFGDLVDIWADTSIYKFTEQDLINFSRRMRHVIEKSLLDNNCQVHVISVSTDRQNRTVISFYVETLDPNTKEKHILSAGLLEEKLKQKLTEHKFIFDYPIVKFQSRVCYNSCGGHGRCGSHSHRCKCHLPWMNNPWHEGSTGFSNCDMHVMIIVLICVATIFVSILLFLSLRTMARICRRKRKYGKDVLRYKLLDNTES